MYTIGEFATLTEVPVRTLRYYDAIGVLRPALVERGSGYRRYSAAQLERLNHILAFKDLGFPLEEIRRLVADGITTDELREILRLQREELERRVMRERARLARAAARLELMEGGAAPEVHGIAIRTAGPRLVASVRDTIASHDECTRLFDELHRHTCERGTRQRGAIWHACRESAIDCEVFEFLRAPIRASPHVRVYELPGQWVASLVYRGDHDFMPAYAAIRSWLAASRLRITGPKREIFLEQNGDQPMTEIQFPIADPMRSSGRRAMRPTQRRAAR